MPMCLNNIRRYSWIARIRENDKRCTPKGTRLHFRMWQRCGLASVGVLSHSVVRFSFLKRIAGYPQWDILLNGTVVLIRLAYNALEINGFAPQKRLLCLCENTLIYIQYFLGTPRCLLLFCIQHCCCN